MLPTTPPLPVVVCNSAGVTVSDIFNALYNTLNSPITPSIWDDLNLPLIVTSSPATTVRSHSYEEHPSDTWPKLKAERKIDLLEGRTVFEGLEIGKLGTWELATTRARHAHDTQH
ncbi:hypothetical protein BU17DRAFT_51591 [Hysterangium stoloniferum]|nr:hypothetical protein BU17DRAFT_51591 [Hysterangium stoloniferum]